MSGLQKYSSVMGATTSVCFKVMPGDLDSASVENITNNMFYITVLISATLDQDESSPIPSLSTWIKIRECNFVMISSSNERTHFAEAFYRVFLRLSKRET